jgi:3-hydroxybutyryl-CoA dehydrogenase
MLTFISLPFMLRGEMASVRNVLVVGGGTMGSQIALQTALSGRHEVFLVDASDEQLERARAQNEKLVARGVEKERYSKETADRALEAISLGTDLDAPARGADLVIEAVFEDFAVKSDIFARADAAAPAHAILASNSSSIVISRLAAVTGRPDRCCNLHFFHPVTVMPLCEVGQGPETSDATIATAMEFVRGIDRVPVHIRREVHGFVVNRILVEAMEEALRLLEGGYATFQDIDIAVRKGLNWPMGPFELLDFSGIDVFYGVLEDRHRLGEGPEPSRILREKVERGELGRKTGRGFYDYGEGK